MGDYGRCLAVAGLSCASCASECAGLAKGQGWRAKLENWDSRGLARRLALLVRWLLEAQSSAAIQSFLWRLRG
jgi:hypothetical protein